MKATPTNRETLHDMLVEVLGNNNVYFNPPESIKMKFPAIVYRKNRIDNTYAGNSVYRNIQTYTVTLIDEDPESETIHKLLNLPFCKYDRPYISNGMYHDVFTIKF